LSALEFRHILRSCGNKKDIIVAETGGLPFATRLIAPGKVKIFHIRAVCALAAIPGNRGRELFNQIENLYPFELKDSVSAECRQNRAFTRGVLHV